MNINTITNNCDYKKHYQIEELASSSVEFTLELPKIVSQQSKKVVIDEFKRLMQEELSKFDWIIAGSVNVELLWYINAVQRQETDKIGDIDNISKPIQDGLVGPNALLIDDSQIGSLYTYWMSRSDVGAHDIVKLSISFNNDTVLEKKNLKFIQYHNAICIPVNIDESNLTDFLIAKMLISSRKLQRRAARKIQSLGENADRYLVCSTYDFHRTRLNTFPTSSILSIDQLNTKAINAGLTTKHYYDLLRSKPS